MWVAIISYLEHINPVGIEQVYYPPISLRLVTFFLIKK